MKRIRRFLPLAALFLACSSKDDTVQPPAELPGPVEWNRPVTPPADDEASTKRKACGYDAGSLPAETQGKSHPMGDKIPIDTILVVMMENRSFDHYFQKLPENGQTDVEVAPKDFSNPDKDGKPIAIHRDELLCFVDTAHGWNASHRQFGSGKMNGFVVSNDEPPESMPVGPGATPDLLSGVRAMTYYEASDLPFMFWAANEYAIGDHYHCSILGPTWPNRMYLYGATSLGRTSNKIPAGTVKASILDNLELRKIDWKIYASLSPGAAVFVPDRIIKYRDHVVDGSQYFEDAAAGKLPQFAFVDPNIGSEKYDQNDEHPPAVMAIGQAWMAKVVDALHKSPQWKRSALFITYDEHGGLYDHVVPPAACPPDDVAAELGAGDEPGKFDQLGFRVPLVVISPFAKKHFVGHHVYDHTSITRFIEARFTMPAMTKRDANAEAPWEMFDFDNPPHLTAPTNMPAVPVDAAKMDACKKIWVK